MSAALDAAIQAGCQDYHNLGCTPLQCNCENGCEWRERSRVINSIRAFLDAVGNSQQPISHDATQTLRAHLGEGYWHPIR